MCGVQPQVVVAVIADSFRTLSSPGLRGIANSNAMVTERYISCMTVSRNEPYGQVSGRTAASPGE
jgi:hypothetical protein